MTDRTMRPSAVIAVVPARGGSKGVPGKNLRPVGGVPLLARALRSCRSSGAVDRLVVTTDDAGIASVARAEGAEVVHRPDELAGDEASSESALLHALDEIGADDDDVLVFVQCTSPFVDAGAMSSGVERVRSKAVDAVFSAVESYEFVWRTDDDGVAAGLNHDPSRRLRRQDRRPDHVETGAFYVMGVGGFRAARHRFFGRVGVATVPTWTAVEIDEPADLALAEAIAASREPDGVDVGVDIDVLVTDFDGVHTDDRVIVHADGSESVVASRSDGYGVELLRRAGVEVIILSREQHHVVAARARKLGVECVHGVRDKWPVLDGWLADRGIDTSRVAYLGNDVNDAECMEHVAWPVAVADAHTRVRSIARLVLDRPGGQGAVRELAEIVLASRASDRADKGRE